MPITIDDLADLPELEFGVTRAIGEPFEWGKIGHVKVGSVTPEFGHEELIFGVYTDKKSGASYLVHSVSLRPPGGVPTSTELSQIHKYEKTKEYFEKNRNYRK